MRLPHNQESKFLLVPPLLSIWRGKTQIFFQSPLDIIGSMSYSSSRNLYTCILLESRVFWLQYNLDVIRMASEAAENEENQK